MLDDLDSLLRKLLGPEPLSYELDGTARVAQIQVESQYPLELLFDNLSDQESVFLNLVKVNFEKIHVPGFGRLGKRDEAIDGTMPTAEVD